MCQTTKVVCFSIDLNNYLVNTLFQPNRKRPFLINKNTVPEIVLVRL